MYKSPDHTRIGYASPRSHTTHAWRHTSVVTQSHTHTHTHRETHSHAYTQTRLSIRKRILPCLKCQCLRRQSAEYLGERRELPCSPSLRITSEPSACYLSIVTLKLKRSTGLNKSYECRKTCFVYLMHVTGALAYW